jgi:hypothetical protein
MSGVYMRHSDAASPLIAPSSWRRLSRPSTTCLLSRRQDVDARHEAGHDGGEAVPRRPRSVILRCEPRSGEPRRMSAAEMPLALLPRPGRRPSRLAALAPQGDGTKLVRAAIKDNPRLSPLTAPSLWPRLSRMMGSVGAP